jgi:YgiT-type zinc finger domain-containing protein
MRKERFEVSVCPTCGSSDIRKVSGKWTGNYRGETYAVCDLEYFTCPKCDEKVYTPDAMRQIQQASPAYSKPTARRSGRSTPNQAA